MLSPARLTQLIMEIIFLMLGLLVVGLGAKYIIRFDPRSGSVLVLGVALIAWGLMAFSRPGQLWARWQKWNRGGSLVLLGLILLAMSRVPFLFVPKLLMLLGVILILRGLVGSLLIFKQS
jgi:hypothetical protein